MEAILFMYFVVHRCTIEFRSIYQWQKGACTRHIKLLYCLQITIAIDIEYIRYRIILFFFRVNLIRIK